MIKVGEHITLDIIGTDKEYDPSVYERVIKEIAKVAKVTILNISKYKFEPQGFTILALLAESHISFHTFPEKGIISFDFFTCGKISPSVAIDIVKKEFKSSFVFIFLFPLPSYPPLFDFAIKGKVQLLISSSERFLKSSILIHFGQGIFILSIYFF